MSNWTRAQLKTRAKEVLKINYWIAFVVGLILFVSLGGSYANNSRYTFSKDDIKNHDEIIEFGNDFKYDVGEIREKLQDNRSARMFAGIFAGMAVFYTLMALAVKIFLFNPLAVGCYRFYSTAAENPHKNMSPVGHAFKKGNYNKIIGGMLLKNLFIFLWSLLFIIPGIIKSYSYRMVPYILAASPDMDATEAITLSRKMMNGEKWRTFVLDLSFIGWFLLGLLTFGIGNAFLLPYYYSTDAQLYLALKEKAVENKLIAEETLYIPAI